MDAHLHTPAQHPQTSVQAFPPAHWPLTVGTAPWRARSRAEVKQFAMKADKDLQRNGVWMALCLPPPVTSLSHRHGQAAL